MNVIEVIRFHTERRVFVTVAKFFLHVSIILVRFRQVRDVPNAFSVKRNTRIFSILFQKFYMIPQRIYIMAIYMISNLPCHSYAEKKKGKILRNSNI